MFKEDRYTLLKFQHNNLHNGKPSSYQVVVIYNVHVPTNCFCPLGDDAVSSGLSEHSSDRLQLPPSKPVAPVTTAVSKKEAGCEDRDGREASDDDSELLTPSASESTLVNGKPITSDTSSAKKELQKVYISHLHYTCNSIRCTCTVHMYMYYRVGQCMSGYLAIPIVLGLNGVLIRGAPLHITACISVKPCIVELLHCNFI